MPAPHVECLFGARRSRRVCASASIRRSRRNNRKPGLNREPERAAFVTRSCCRGHFGGGFQHWATAMISRRKFLQWTGGFAAGGAALASYGFYIEPVIRAFDTPMADNPARMVGRAADAYRGSGRFPCWHSLDDRRARGPHRQYGYKAPPDLIVLLGDYLPGVCRVPAYNM
jgi:hypothetical protein